MTRPVCSRASSPRRPASTGSRCRPPCTRRARAAMRTPAPRASAHAPPWTLPCTHARTRASHIAHGAPRPRPTGAVPACPALAWQVPASREADEDGVCLIITQADPSAPNLQMAKLARGETPCKSFKQAAAAWGSVLHASGGRAASPLLCSGGGGLCTARGEVPACPVERIGTQRGARWLRSAQLAAAGDRAALWQPTVAALACLGCGRCKRRAPRPLF